MKKRVAIFGLSANPPTGDGGHRGIIRYLYERGNFDVVFVVPVFQHMYAAKLIEMAPFSDRVAMLTANCEDILNKNSSCELVISNIEEVLCQLRFQSVVEAGSISAKTSVRVGTFDLVTYLREYHFNTEEYDLHLVLGADTYQDLIRGKWMKSDQYVTSNYS